MERWITRLMSRGMIGSALVLIVASVAGAVQPLLQKAGDPQWEPVDFHLFSAPIGTAASGYTEFGQTTDALLPSPNHVHHPDLGVGPGAPHSPPYDHELAGGVASNGYVDKDSFTVADWTSPSGVYTAFMVVPTADAPKGSSPDFASGPIIPNTACPIAVTIQVSREGVPFDVGAGSVPALNAINPPFNVDGHSHFPYFVADTADFLAPGTPLTGSYNFAIQFRDAGGNGWDISVPFQVVPEPASVALLAGALLWGARRRPRPAR